jgi:hypothetical protein
MQFRSALTSTLFLLALSQAACDTSPSTDDDEATTITGNECPHSRDESAHAPSRQPPPDPTTAAVSSADPAPTISCRRRGPRLPLAAPAGNTVDPPGETELPARVTLPPEWPELRAWLEGQSETGVRVMSKKTTFRRDESEIPSVPSGRGTLEPSRGATNAPQ